MNEDERRPRYTTLRHEVLRVAARRDLQQEEPRIEKCAFALSKMGLLYAPAYGSSDYVITTKGRAVLSEWDSRTPED
jgi:hypothetical protein